MKLILFENKWDRARFEKCPAPPWLDVQKMDNLGASGSRFETDPHFPRQNLPFGSSIRNFLLFVILNFLLTMPLFAQGGRSEKLIKVTTGKEGNRTLFYVDNLQASYVTVTFELDLANLGCTHELPYTVTLPPRSHTEAFDLTPKNSDKDSSWSYTYYATWGRLNVKHDDSAVYILPFAVGTAYPVSQGYDGNFSHTGGDRYSLDFRMPLGTPVHCARDGEVVGIKDDSEIGGPDKKFEWDANYVLVRHADGTLGHYVHLMKGGCRVKVGQHVKAGDWIALSGNTGFTTGPHLHFAVFKAHDGKTRETIPVRYRTFQASEAIALKEGQVYRAILPGLTPPTVAPVPVSAVTTTRPPSQRLPEAAGKPQS
ncbi:MAG: putative secreted peptidase [Verrucomicrobiales bacterium]|nr:putative secreted peptidase [Verrucomicrobiales bacterium]